MDVELERTSGTAYLSRPLIVNNCDFDNDGVLGTACGGEDCDDADGNAYPDNPESCDAIDNDCDGFVDEVCCGDLQCADFEVCANGVCGAPCDLTTGDLCDSAVMDSETAVCDVDAGICRAHCTVSGQTGYQCAVGEFCAAFPERVARACYVSECGRPRDPACPSGTTCMAAGQQAGRCLPVGEAAVGDACRVATDPAATAAELCAEGLRCVSGACVAECDTGSESVVGDCADEALTCERVVYTEPTMDVGVCVELCHPYSAETCGEGRACRPYVNSYGAVGFTCTMLGAGGRGDACDPGRGECGEGLYCTDHLEPVTATCQPYCDMFPGSSNSDFSRCASGTCEPMGPTLLGLCRP